MQVTINHYQKEMINKNMFKKLKLDFEFITKYDQEHIEKNHDNNHFNKAKWNKQFTEIMLS